MGIKRLSKRLEKLGRRAARDLGKSGKPWVRAVFETAIGVIEERLRQPERKPAKPAKAGARAQATRPTTSASASRAAGAKVVRPAARPSRSRAVAPGKRPERRPSARHASVNRAELAPVAREPSTPTPAPDHSAEPSAT